MVIQKILDLQVRPPLSPFPTPPIDPRLHTRGETRSPKPMVVPELMSRLFKVHCCCNLSCGWRRRITSSSPKGNYSIFIWRYVTQVYVVFISIEAQPIEELLTLAHHKTSSRVLDVVFESPTVTPKSKRALVMAFIGHYHQLVDDKFGSRVADRCWDNADPYLKVCRLIVVLCYLST